MTKKEIIAELHNYGKEEWKIRLCALLELFLSKKDSSNKAERGER